VFLHRQRLVALEAGPPPPGPHRLRRSRRGGAVSVRRELPL
jgi:hypothetical protein